MANNTGRLLVGGILLLLIGTSGPAKAATPPKKSKPQPKPDDGACDTGPFVFEVGEVWEAIQDAIDDGMRTDMKVAVWVATDLWPQHAWPPQPGADEYQQCVWSLLLAEIQRFKEDAGIPPWPPCDDNSNYEDGVCVPSGPQPIPLDPWLNPDPWWPMPETFYQGEAGDIFLGTNPGDSHSVVYSTLLSAAYTAAKEIGGVSNEEATAFAQQVAGDPEARLDYLELILCSPWNDALYGTYGYDINLIGNFSAPSGRALRLLPMHYNNFDRIRQGIPPKRNVKLGNPASPGDKSGTPMNGAQHSFEFYWLPGINLTLLWESGGQLITTQGLTWEDGSTKLMPPPVVTNLGADGVPPGQWGCAGNIITTEEL